MLILSETAVRSVLSLDLVLEAVARACVEHSSGRTVIPPRVLIRIPEHAGETLFMPGYLTKDGAYGLKIVSNFAKNPDRGLPIGPGLLVLLDRETGIPQAVIDASYMTDLRTGVLSGLACRYLARKEAHVLGIIGSGAQARTQLQAIAHVLALDRVLVFSRRRENVDRFVSEMALHVPHVQFSAADNAREVVTTSDVVVAATTSLEPVVQGNWLRPGVCVCGVGSHTLDAQELDEEVFRRADIVAVDSRGALISGDLALALERKAIMEDDLVELGEMIHSTGTGPARRSEGDITVFKCVGFAAADLMIAIEVFSRAKSRKLGVEVDLA